jgi:hypothetical protein
MVSQIPSEAQNDPSRPVGQSEWDSHSRGSIVSWEATRVVVNERARKTPKRAGLIFIVVVVSSSSSSSSVCCLWKQIIISAVLVLVLFWFGYFFLRLEQRVPKPHFNIALLFYYICLATKYDSEATSIQKSLCNLFEKSSGLTDYISHTVEYVGYGTSSIAGTQYLNLARLSLGSH